MCELAVFRLEHRIVQAVEEYEYGHFPDEFGPNSFGSAFTKKIIMCFSFRNVLVAYNLIIFVNLNPMRCFTFIPALKMILL